MAYEPIKDIETAGKRHKAEEVVTKLRKVDDAQGKSMAEAIRDAAALRSLPITAQNGTCGENPQSGSQILGSKPSEGEASNARRRLCHWALTTEFASGWGAPLLRQITLTRQGCA